MFDKLTILGVGLLGASFALAAREKHICKQIAGSGRSEANLRRAKELGIIDSYDLSPAVACEDADLIILSAPVGSFTKIIGSASSSLKKGSVITDVGSVKGTLVYELEKLMPEGVFYIGSHPIAGSDKSGIETSNPELFKNARCIVTPTENSNPDALKKIVNLWSSIGADVTKMDPHNHDFVYAAVSHFPHLAAYALVNSVNTKNDSYLSYAGQGFKDMTRIASSSPELWRDICMLNRDNILDMLMVFQTELDKMREHLETGDAASLKKDFEKAQGLREKLG